VRFIEMSNRFKAVGLFCRALWGEFTRSSLIFSRKFQSFENFNFSLNFSSTTVIPIYIISNFSGEEYGRIL
jgi:hypothetical protein